MCLWIKMEHPVHSPRPCPRWHAVTRRFSINRRCPRTLLPYMIVHRKYSIDRANCEDSLTCETTCVDEIGKVTGTSRPSHDNRDFFGGFCSSRSGGSRDVVSNCEGVGPRVAIAGNNLTTRGRRNGSNTWHSRFSSCH